MYNDYWLQQIDAKLSNFDDLLTNQNIIIQNQEFIIDYCKSFDNMNQICFLWLIVAFFAILFYFAFKGMFKGR